MNSIDIKKLDAIKNELDNLEEDDVLFINEEGKEKYVLMPIDLYDSIDETLALYDEDKLLKNPQIRIINANSFELSYDEYENVKKQIMDAFEKTFKPKPEKLN